MTSLQGGVEEKNSRWRQRMKYKDQIKTALEEILTGKIFEKARDCSCWEMMVANNWKQTRHQRSRLQ